MLPNDVRTLLAEAPPGRHIAQLHRDTQSLVTSVGTYVGTGLERGGGVLILASADHTEVMLRDLARRRFDVDGPRQSGRLVILDADATLARILRGGRPIWPEFQRVILPMIEHLNRAGPGACRVYGDLVSPLWSRGRYAAVIQLEEYWTALAQSVPFSMFCSYVLDSHDHRCYHTPLADIGRTHSEIITGDDDEAFRAALDRASQDVFGAPLSQTITVAAEHLPGEHRLPTGQRTMLWIQRTLPTSSADILQRARAYLTA